MPHNDVRAEIRMIEKALPTTVRGEKRRPPTTVRVPEPVILATLAQVQQRRHRKGRHAPWWCVPLLLVLLPLSTGAVWLMFLGPIGLVVGGVILLLAWVMAVTTGAAMLRARRRRIDEQRPMTNDQ